MPADRDRAVLRPRRGRGLRLGDRDEPERRPWSSCRARSGVLPKVAAVGPGTAETLREVGVEPAFVPRVSSQDGLLAEFPRPAGRVLFAAAQGARRRPIEELGADFVALYTTRLVRPTVPPEGDLVVLASGSAARSFAELGVDIPAVTIGPQTTEAARAAGLRVRRRGGDARSRRPRRAPWID